MKRIYKVQGMTCQHCQQKIEQSLKEEVGVDKVKVSLKKAEVYADLKEEGDSEKIIACIQKLGYEASAVGEEEEVEEEKSHALLYGAIALLAFIVVSRFVPDLSLLLTEGRKVSSMMLFIIGLTTSFHCISMCGGIALSQVVADKDNIKRNMMYNVGRVISYTLLGGVVGFLGAGITLGNRFYGVVPVILGGLMVIVGLGNAGILAIGQWGPLQKFNQRLGGLKARLGSDKGPFILGLLNGFMPCGPLQLMQIYALSTGSFFAGAASMFAFSLGTIPLMLGMGAFVHKLSIKSRMMVYKVGGYLIILLGMSMLANGLATLGVKTPSQKSVSAQSQGDKGTSQEPGIRMEDGYQVVAFDVRPRGYKDIVVQKGVPVKMILNVPVGGLNGCNYALQIPEFDIFTTLKEGENIITFTPNEAGDFMYSCWMGMIRNRITVVEGAVEDYEPVAPQTNGFFDFGGSGFRCH